MGDPLAAMLAAIEAAGIGRAEIARRAGISPVTIWRHRVGGIAAPKSQTVAAVQTLHRAVVERRGAASDADAL